MKKPEEQTNQKNQNSSCNDCGSDRVMLTEVVNDSPRCADCGAVRKKKDV